MVSEYWKIAKRHFDINPSWYLYPKPPSFPHSNCRAYSSFLLMTQKVPIQPYKFRPTPNTIILKVHLLDPASLQLILSQAHQSPLFPSPLPTSLLPITLY